MLERRREPLAPIILPLIQKGFDKEPARVAEDSHQQEDPDPRPSNPDPFLTEVDLELVPWRHFDADGRQLCDSPLASKVCHSALDGPDTDREPTLRQQSLHDDRVATGRSVVERPSLASPIVGQPSRRRSDPLSRLYRPAQISAHRVHRNADLARNGLLTDPATRQRANRGHQLAFDHRYLPDRRYQHVPLELHLTLPEGSELVS
jgi:hypothetical protein